MSTIDTPVALETGVRDVIAQLHALRANIPGLVRLAPAHARKMVTAATVPDRFLEKIANVIERATLLQGVSRIPTSSYRNVIVFTTIYEMLVAELEAFLREVRDMILLERHDVAQEALRVYSVARKFNRPSDRLELLPFLDELAEALHHRQRSSGGSGGQEPPSDTAPPPNGNSGNEGGKK